MMSKSIVMCLAAFAVVCATAHAQTVTEVIGNFEGGSLDGWQPVSDGPSGFGVAGPPNTLTQLSSVVGAGIANTNGLNALRIGNGPGAQNFWAIQLNDTGSPGLADKIAAAAAHGGSLKADVTFVASQFNIATSNWAQWNKVSIQTPANNYWKEVEVPAGVDPGWNASLGNQTATYQWPLASIDATGGTFANIIMSINYDRGAYANVNAPAFFADNIRIEYTVPEPGALALIAMGGSTLAIIRRRYGRRS
jgi:hypothetical protein